MTTQPTGRRVRPAAVALGGIAVIATAACAASAPGPAPVRQQPMAVTAVAAASVPVVVDCAVHSRTRPGQYILACANGGAYLASLHWATWGSSTAFADGISTFNDCVPNCVAGHGHSFPVLVVLWRPTPLAGHAGERYFTRLTIIYTGSRTYSAGGRQYHLPVTSTDPLSASGGA